MKCKSFLCAISICLFIISINSCNSISKVKLIIGKWRYIDIQPFDKTKDSISEMQSYFYQGMFQNTIYEFNKDNTFDYEKRDTLNDKGKDNLSFLSMHGTYEISKDEKNIILHIKSISGVSIPGVSKTQQQVIFELTEEKLKLIFDDSNSEKKILIFEKIL